MNQINLKIVQNYSFFVLFLILFLTIGFQVLITPVNKEIAHFRYRRKNIVLFRMILILLLSGIYFYQLIFPYFFTNESAEIIGTGNTVINQDIFSLFIKMLFVFLIIFVIISIVIIRYHLLSTRLKERALKEQELGSYIKTMEVLQTDIRKIHHDYKNLITALGGYLYDDSENVDVKGLKLYYEENVMMQKEVELKTINLSKLQKLEIFEIKGLLAAKLIQASQQSIKVAIEVQDVIEILPIDTLDLTRIVGILMDNAIEAAVECPNPEVRIAFILNKNITVFIVENTTVNALLPISQLSKVGVSTKGPDRGLGLSNISELLEQYPNAFLETRLENGYFQQRIVFQGECI